MSEPQPTSTDRPAPTRRRRHERLPASVPASPAPASTHPLIRRHYRVATVAIEELVDLVEHCVRLLIPGALVHARPRMGKTHAIDYAAIHLARHRPDLLVLRMSCEHHRTQFEGPFFNALLAATGIRDTLTSSISHKRFALIRRLSEQLQVRGGHIVVLYCDEAQRLRSMRLTVVSVPGDPNPADAVGPVPVGAGEGSAPTAAPLRKASMLDIHPV
jgi:hypothetical protein